MPKHMNKRRGPGMPAGAKKKKLKPQEELRKTKASRFTDHEIALIERAVKLTKCKNFSRYVVDKVVSAAEQDIERLG